MDRVRLLGWKAIGRHFGRDARTAQRWEHERGLPVQRIPGEGAQSVYAYVDELDGWLNGSRSIRPQAYPGTVDTRAATAHHPHGLAPGLLVLPFNYHALGSDLRFVGDGLAGELIGRLATAKLASMRVLSWTTSKSYRETSKRAQQIGDELSVRFLVEGSVKEVGARWRIDITVVDAERDSVLFTDRFGCAGREILLLQAQIAEAVSAQLALHLAGSLIDCEWTREVDPAALLCHLDAMRLVEKGSVESMQSALARLDEAMRIDASYAPARAVSGLTMINLAQYQPEQNERLFELARQYGAESRSAAPELNTTALLSALLAYFDYDWKYVEKILVPRIAATPSSVVLRGRLSNALSAQRRFGEAEAALAPVPMLERSTESMTWLGRRLLWERRFDEARHCFDQVLASAPGNAFASTMRFMAAIYGNDLELAREAQQAIPKALHRPLGCFLTGILAARSGEVETARRCRSALHEQVENGEANWYHAAMISGLLSEPEAAAEYLARSMQRHELAASLAGVDPCFDGVRASPAVRARTRAMNLPD